MGTHIRLPTLCGGAEITLYYKDVVVRVGVIDAVYIRLIAVIRADIPYVTVDFPMGSTPWSMLSEILHIRLCIPGHLRLPETPRLDNSCQVKVCTHYFAGSSAICSIHPWAPLFMCFAQG